MNDPIADELRKGIDDLLNTKTEAMTALINIRAEAGMASIYINEVLHGSSGNTGDLLRHVEQNLHTIEEHLGNVLGDVLGEEKEDG